MTTTPLLLLIRPEAQSRRLLDEIEAHLGHPVPALISPVFRIEATGLQPDLEQYAGVILTSGNGARLAPDLAGRRVWCVGEQTAQAARERGASIVAVAQDATSLLATITAEAPAGKLLHLAGTHRRGDIAESLNAAGIETETAAIYAQTAELLGTAAREVLQGDLAAVLPLYSPRSARLLGQEIDRLGSGTHVIALSPAVAESWMETTGGTVEICATPTGGDMRQRIVAALQH